MFQTKTPTSTAEPLGKHCHNILPLHNNFNQILTDFIFSFCACYTKTVGTTQPSARIGLAGAWNRFEICEEDDYLPSSKAFDSMSGTKGDASTGKTSSALTAMGQYYPDMDEDDFGHMAPNVPVDYTVANNKYLYDNLSEKDYIATGDIIATEISYNNNYTPTQTTLQSDIMLLDRGISSVTASTYNEYSIGGLYAGDVAMMHGNQMIADDRFGAIGTMSAMTTSTAMTTTATTTTAAPIDVTSLTSIATTSATPTTIADIRAMVTQSQQLLTGDTSNHYCDNSATNVAYNLADVQHSEDDINQIDNSDYLRDLYSSDQYIENTHKQLVFNPVS